MVAIIRVAAVHPTTTDRHTLSKQRLHVATHTETHTEIHTEIRDVRQRTGTKGRDAGAVSLATLQWSTTIVAVANLLILKRMKIDTTIVTITLLQILRCVTSDTAIVVMVRILKSLKYVTDAVVTPTKRNQLNTSPSHNHATLLPMS